MIRNPCLDEEGVRAGDIAADQPIALAPAERRERVQRRAELAAAVPLVFRVVRHHPAHGRVELGVVLDDHDAGRDHGERFPHVIVVAVDVDAQKVRLGRQRETGHERFDVFTSHHGLLQPESAVVDRAGEAGADRFRELGGSLDPHARPALLEQAARVVLASVGDADFDEHPVGRADASEDFRDQPVLIVLRVHLVAAALEP